jgi:Protein of unknown function (DUF4232)
MTRSLRTARRAAAGAALAGAAAAITACGGAASPSAAPAKAVTVTATPAVSARAAAGSPVAPPSPASPPAPDPCPTRYLGVKVGLSQGTAGSVYQVIDFRNISNVTCTLYGYPGVSFGSTGTSGGQIGAAAQESPVTPRELVVLAPGAVANALLQIADAGNVPPARCGQVTAHWLVIYPPGQTTPVYLSYTSPACAKPVRILTVSVVQPGAGGLA